jgi:predicted Zn-dependent protease
MSGGGDVDDELDAVIRLRLERRHEEHLAAAQQLAAQRPSSTLVRMEAAYALDRHGDEAGAIRHYDAAWRLGVPDELRRTFVVGYGSTLRNVGRAEEAVVLLTEEAARDPDYPPLAAFLALALHSAGHASAALATMLGCLLDVTQRHAGAVHPLDGYQRALGEYYRELIEREVEASTARATGRKPLP